MSMTSPIHALQQDYQRDARVLVCYVGQLQQRYQRYQRCFRSADTCHGQARHRIVSKFVSNARNRKKFNLCESSA